MNNEVVTFLAPKSANEAFEIAKNLSQSSMIPSGLKGRPADIVVAMAYGAELGLQPLQSLQNIAVINGRPSLWGDAMRALVLNSHDLVSLKEWNKGDVFYCEIIRKSRSGGDIIIQKSFGNADAEKAKLLGKAGPWTQYPDRMKQMRAFGFAARDAYADRLRGFITREEAEDMSAQERDITPQAQSAQQTGNAAIDAIMTEATNNQESNEIQGDESALTQEEFDLWVRAIVTSDSIDKLAGFMEQLKGVPASEGQLGDLKKAASVQKKKLTSQSQIDFN